MSRCATPYGAKRWPRVESRTDQVDAGSAQTTSAAVGALVHESGVRFRAGSSDWMDEIESPSRVQDEVPRSELGRLRSRPGPSRRHHHLGVPGGHRRLGTGRTEYAGRAAEVLGPRDPHRPDVTSSLPSAAPAGRGLSRVALRADGPRPSVTRSHDAVPSWPTPRPEASARSKVRRPALTLPPETEPARTLDFGRWDRR